VRTARFVAEGRVHEGTAPEEGTVLDAAGRAYPESEVELLPPVEPRSVIAVALNYSEHAEEFDMQAPEEPALFFKPPNTWIGHRALVVYPSGAEYVHYEVELAAVIGRSCRRVKASEAGALVKGYTIANDLVVRDFVGDFYRPPVKAKGWDTFCPLGPYLVTPDEIGDPYELELRAFVNGELRQKGTTAGMIRKVPELIEYISEFMTLGENDVILTGTPKGVSHVYPGDVMRLEIDGLSALENQVVAESGATKGVARG
jgi:5-oxopent-3-ene-1,2,5-tricarboxylate decarboxylase / 2-hydroxyhepta-2,4-diene-1,7-dioate isomerase